MPRGKRDSKKLLNYTTEVEPIRSAHEIMGLLAAKGARRVQIEYEDAQPVALSFCILFQGQEMPFKLPCNVEGVGRALRRLAPPSRRSEAQAKRTAWRIVKDYVEAQLAIIESEQAEMAEVFMAYAITSNGQTLFQRMTQDPSRLLGSGQPEEKVVQGNFG